jgi:serine/threonine-protein kinase
VRPSRLSPDPPAGPDQSGSDETGAVSEPAAALSSQDDTDSSFFSSFSGRRSGPGKIAVWGRYRDLELIGQGATSRVYRAHDPKLQRKVALKLLQGDDPDQVERFLKEARAQCRFDHEFVCKVYDVDTVDGQPYIAMQYVEGMSLDQARDQLSREEIVRIISDVALAVHEAHGAGIIHRDLKPKNIMVEPAVQDGRWHPWVLDFGLARKVDASEHSTTGMVTGTPAYMSPEQAQGLSELDGRTDIYSLGCTLYRLLTGRTQFDGCRGVDMLVSIVKEEPERPRQIEPSLPNDLEAIILQCMEKEPDRRYESARALAKDLRRFLTGLPIAARRHHLGYRLLKLMRRHRSLGAALMVAVLAVVLAIGSVVRARNRTRVRTEAAKRLGQEIEEMAQTMRFAAMLPLHDTRPEQELVEQRMRAIEQEVAARGELDPELADYALGCGYLALGEIEAAYRHLDRAWQGGYRAPELEHALGRAMGNLYQAALADTRFHDPELRQARISELAHRYKEPALAHLRAGAAVKQPTAVYINGLIALYEDRYDDALQAARRAFAEVPWFYEARHLEGAIHVRLGMNAQERGRHEQALAAYLEAGECYAEAISIADSDATLYLSEARRLVRMMTLRADRGESPESELQQVLGACDKALLVSPGWADAYGVRVLAHLAQAEFQGRHGHDPSQALAAATADAEAAVADAAQNPELYLLLGWAQRILARHQQHQGRDPSAALQAAINGYDQALQLDELYADAHANRAVAQWALAQYQMEHGIDPAPALAEASRSLQRAAELSPETALLHNNLGNISHSHALHAMNRGHDPGPFLAQAEASYRQAVALNPDNGRTHSNLGNVLRLQGELAVAAGNDPSGYLDDAIAGYRAALAINPNLLGPYNNLALALQTRASYEMGHGIDPLPSCAEALQALDSVLERAPQLVPVLYNQGLVLATRSRFLAMIGRDPSPDLEAAITSLRAALAIDSGDPETMVLLASAHLIAAEHGLERRQPASASLAAAEQLLHEAQAIDASRCDIHQARGRLELIRARRQQRPADLGPARTAFEQARQCNPGQAAIHLELARIDHMRVLWSLPASPERATVCRRGIAAADQALGLNPSLAEAMALRGALRLQLAETAGSSERRSLREQGTADLEAAIATNSFLGHRWGEAIR